MDENTWSTAPTLLGSHIVSGPSRGLILGYVPLTPDLLNHNLPNLEPTNVIPLVAKKLSYRVQSFDG